MQPELLEQNNHTKEPAQHASLEPVVRERLIIFDETEYQTNLPEYADIFEGGHYIRGDIKSFRIENLELLPTALDKLEPGKYFVRGTSLEEAVDDQWNHPHSVSHSRDVTVRASGHGKVIDNDSFFESYSMLAGTETLMRALGYEVTESPRGSQISGVPTPETLVVALKERGIDIKLFPDYQCIPGSEYLQAYAEGKYPVSSSNEIYYEHDIGDDHLGAVMLGGAILVEALQTAAINGLKGDDGAIHRTSIFIDTFTANLRAVILPITEFSEGANAEADGRGRVHTNCERLGISMEKCDEIIKTVQAEAVKMGMDIVELQ